MPTACFSKSPTAVLHAVCSPYQSGFFPFPFCGLLHFNVWSPACRLFKKKLGSVTLLKEMCYLGWVLRLQNPMPGPACLCLLTADQDVRSQLLFPCHACLPAAMLPWHKAHELTL